MRIFYQFLDYMEEFTQKGNDNGKAYRNGGCNKNKSGNAFYLVLPHNLLVSGYFYQEEKYRRQHGAV